MFKIQDKNIYLNRGDMITFVVANNTTTFSEGDYLTFYICEKGDYTNIVFQKRIDVTKKANEVEIQLTTEETKIGEPIKTNERVYWYEIELNGNTTLVGYDEQGPKLITFWPEAVREEE